VPTVRTRARLHAPPPFPAKILLKPRCARQETLEQRAAQVEKPEIFCGKENYDLLTSLRWTFNGFHFYFVCTGVLRTSDSNTRAHFPLVRWRGSACCSAHSRQPNARAHLSPHRSAKAVGLQFDLVALEPVSLSPPARAFPARCKS
jgi:hypothetical protein